MALIRKKTIYSFFLFCALTCFSNDLFAYIYSYETPVKDYLTSISVTEYDTGLDGIDCIYVINLDERIEKWSASQQLLEDSGLKANRVSAINGWKLTHREKKELAGSYDIHLSGGEIGCLLSHVSVLKDAYDRGFERIWVLEDDLEFVEDVHQLPVFLKQLDEIDPSWDIFYTDPDSRHNYGQGVLKNCQLYPRPDQHLLPLQSLGYYIYRKNITKDIMLIRSRFATHSMFFSRKGIEKVLHFFTHVYLWNQIDVDLHYIPNIVEYSTTREIVSRKIGTVSDTCANSPLNEGK